MDWIMQDGKVDNLRKSIRFQNTSPIVQIVGTVIVWSSTDEYGTENSTNKN